MPRKSTFTVDARSVQGNEGATATFRTLKVGTLRKYLSVPDYNDTELMDDHLVSWSGFVDDQGNELPSPADDPGVLDALYVYERAKLVRLLLDGPDGANAQKN